MTRVFTSEYREGIYAVIRRDAEQAALRLEVALLKASVADLLQEAGNALHAIFVAGDEPKWKHPSQRDHLIDLSAMLETLHQKITTDGVQAPKVHSGLPLPTADLIFALRGSLKMNQGEFADHVGVSQAAVCRWESGEREPRGDMAVKLAGLITKHLIGGAA